MAGDVQDASTQPADSLMKAQNHAQKASNNFFFFKGGVDQSFLKSRLKTATWHRRPILVYARVAQILTAASVGTKEAKMRKSGR